MGGIYAYYFLMNINIGSNQTFVLILVSALKRVW